MGVDGRHPRAVDGPDGGGYHQDAHSGMKKRKSEDYFPNLELSIPVDRAKITDPVDPMQSVLREHD